jgi:hypothetical protein
MRFHRQPGKAAVVRRWRPESIRRWALHHYSDKSLQDLAKTPLMWLMVVSFIYRGYCWSVAERVFFLHPVTT